MSTELFFFDAAKLDGLARQLGQSYRAADPFPHIVADDFMPVDVLGTLLEEFPSPREIEWISHFHKYSDKKFACNDEAQLRPFTRHVLAQFNSSTFIAFLEKMTGIEGLIPDPHYEGGGLHQIERGGRLEIHADFNLHKRLHLDRRLNLLLYLNKNWLEEYGGHLELWSRDMSRCEKSVLPIFNRCVVFSTTDSSYHGHPHPLNCPEGVTRKSLAFYYYSNGRPEEERSLPHSTLYQHRPEPKRMSRATAWLKSIFDRHDSL